MDLNNILSISGAPGLYKLVGKMNNGLVVESLVDGKRMPAYATHQISSLEEISIYTKADDVPLKDVFQKIFSVKKGKIEGKVADATFLKELMKEVLPDYDEERVYISDIKKMVKWYNILVEAAIINEQEQSEAVDQNPLKDTVEKDEADVVVNTDTDRKADVDPIKEEVKDDN